VSRIVSVHPLAREELNEAAGYYALRSPRLAAALVAAYEDGLSHVLAFPEAGAVVRRDVRRKVLRRFPYSILYRLIHADEVRVLVFMHHKRRPFYWRDRM
jgi:plasmid stabilization system protein ParE